MENIYDKVVDELHTRKKTVQLELSKQYKKQKPFRMEEVSKDNLMWIYENMKPEDVQYSVETYGEENVNQFIMDCETLRRNNARQV